VNSLILKKLSGFARKIGHYYKKSVLCKIITSVHGCFSRWWSNSAIISLIKKEPKKESVLSKIMHLPMTFLKFVNKKLGVWISEKIEKSVLIDLAKTYMNNMLALNSKFLGCLLLSAVVVNNVLSWNVGKFDLISAGIGAILLILNYNYTDFFDASKLVAFCKKTAGFNCNISDAYKPNYVGTKKALILAVVLGAVCGVLPLKLSLLLVAGSLGVFTVMSYSIVGIFVAVFAAPFVPTMVLAGICLLTTASFLVKAVTQADFVWRKEGIGIGFFLLLLFVSSLFSFSPLKSLMVWAMYLVFAGFFFVIVNTVRTKEQVTALLRVFVIAGAFVAIYGVLQYIFGWNTSNAWIDEEMFEEATMRAYSTMENPNVLGEYLLLLIPLAAVFFLKKGGTCWEKILYIGIFVVACVCMIFTQSRGCWLGLLFAAAIFVTFYNGKLWALAPFALLALPFVIPQTMIDRMMSVGNLGDSSTSYRVFIWKGSFRMLRDFWIGGIGMGEGAFRAIYPLYSYSGIIAPHAHNTFLQLVVEGGIGMLVIFLGMMITFLKKVSAVIKGFCKNNVECLSALAICAGVCGFLLQSMFDYTFYNYRMMAMFFMILALGISLVACKGEEK